MHRSGGFFVLLLMALGVFAAFYLLMGDSFGPADGEYDEDGSAQAAGAGGALGATGLEAGGVKPKTPEELAAEKAAREKAEVEIDPSEGVFGTVTDGAGEPIAGVAIFLFAEPRKLRLYQNMPDEAPIATAVSKEDGSFVVGPSPLDGYAKVRAEAAGYAPTVQRVRQRGAMVDLILDRGGALEIRTLDHDGKAVAGVQVIHSAGTVVTRVLTSEEGIASFPSVPTGTGQLLALKEGFGAVRDGNLAVAPGAKEERTLVLPKGMEVQGTVTNAETERPEPGVSVSIRYPQLPMLEESDPVLTDEEGRFKLVAWIGGHEQFQIRARKAEFAEARLWRSARHKGEPALKIHKPGEAFTGRVVTAARQPAEGVRVTYANMQQEEVGEVPEAVTDENGGFELGVPAWATPGSRFTVVALSDTDGLAIGYGQVAPKKDQRAKEIELTLGGTGQVKGTVKDKSGTPVAGAVITLKPDYAAMQKHAQGNRMVWPMMSTLTSGEFHNLTGLTDLEGRYEIRDVPALHYKVSATFGVDSFTLPDAVRVAEQEAAEADIELGEGGTIEGIVLDSEDRPIPGAYLTASPMTNNRMAGWWQNRPTARSQSDGRFVVRGVSDQRYTLSAYAAGFGNGSEKNLSRGQKDVTIRLKARGWIVGVVAKDGTPHRGTFTVTARPMKSGENINNMMGGMWAPGQQVRTFNTDDGKFEIKGCNAGDYTVSVTTPDGLIAAQAEVVTVVDGRPSREARLELSEGAILTGVVKQDDTGEPIANAWVYANGKAPEGGGVAPPQGHGQTDSKGRYEIKGLGTGRYTVSAYVGGTPVQQQVDLTLGERRQINLAKRAPGTVQFLIVDEQSNPIAGARCNIRTASGTWVNPNWQAMRKEGLIGENFDWNRAMSSGEDGGCTRYHVPPGVLTVWAQKNGYAMAGENPQIEVASGSVTEVTLTLKKTN